jgi:hypothetical protein
VGDHERVIAGGFVRRDQAQDEVVEDVLFVGVGSGRRAGLVLAMPGSVKEWTEDVPQID